MKTNKKKRVVKTREELMADLRKDKNFIEKMKFVREKFYPAVLKSSRNIEDAQTFLSSLATMILQKFLGLMKEKKFNELGLDKILDPKDEKHDALVEMLELFNDMSVFDAKELIEGMKQEIQLFINEEMRTRGLETLKTDWIDGK